MARTGFSSSSVMSLDVPIMRCLPKEDTERRSEASLGMRVRVRKDAISVTVPRSVSVRSEVREMSTLLGPSRPMQRR